MSYNIRHLLEDGATPEGAADHVLPDDPMRQELNAEEEKLTPEERTKLKRRRSLNPYIRAAAKWEDEGVDANEVERYIDSHRQLNTLNALQGPQRDIGNLLKRLTFSEFKSLIDDASASYEAKHSVKTVQKKQASDVDLIFENDEITIISPNTWEASCKYGKDTKWCVAMDTYRGHWDSYAGSRHIKFYYCLSKRIIPRVVVDTTGKPTKDSSGRERIHDWYKVAVVVYPHAKNEDPKLEAWVTSDHLAYDDNRRRMSMTRGEPQTQEERQADPVRRFGRWLSVHKVPSPSQLFVNPTSTT